ncbi:hypothetical protein C806_01718 [Lachnospiraceae bacterium 3-1]|nr:hypothetical protein C806_01718 [Lachnospiraceae bacterium 3-1]
MEYYALIDTNVLLSALPSKNKDSATVKVLDAVFEGKIIPLYHQDILAEYDEVFHREKFHLHEKTLWRQPGGFRNPAVADNWYIFL